MIGQTVGHYRVVEQIGAGGMGEVYRAYDLQLDRDVALKFLPAGALSDESLRKQFRQEALALAKLNHPGVATVYEFSTDHGIDFIAMELIPGTTVRKRIERGPFAETEVARFGMQLADGLAAAHDRGIVHRDLKPQNLMITPDGRLKILDFGLSKLLVRAQDVSVATMSGALGVVAGTVPYMPPEQLLGKSVDARSDIYSAGAVLYEMAVGQRPFPQSSNVEVIEAILHRQPSPPSASNPNISPALDAVILKALEKEPWRRQPSAAAFRTALAEVAGDSASRAPARRRRTQFAIAGALAVVGVAGGLLAGNIGGVRDRWLTRDANPRTATASKSRQSIAVLGFKNLSGRADEAWLSTAFSEMLATELAAGEQLRTIPGESVARMKINLSLPEAESYGRTTLARIRRNLDADHVVLGSYVPLGDGQIRLDIRLQDTNAGEILIATSVKGDERQIDSLVSRAGATLRDRLGVGGMSQADTMAVRATLPPSHDAARYYSIGLQRLREFDYLRAREALLQAVAVSPDYALAHSALAAAWKGLGYDKHANEEGRKAVELSKSFSREVRLFIRGQYEELSNRWVDAIATYRALVDFFPDNLDYGLRLASAQTSAGRGKDARATIERLRALPSPESDDARIDLVEAAASAGMGDFKRQQASASMAATKADGQGARLLAAQARNSLCSSFRTLGDPQRAIETCEEARRDFESAGDRIGAARALNTIAVVRMERGDLTEAKKSYDEALAVVHGVGAKRQEAMILNNFAGVLRGQVDLAGSRQMLERALANFRDVDDKGGVARSLDNIGIVLMDEGKPDQARKNYEESLAICREIGSKDLSGYALHLLGEVHSVKDDVAAARKSHSEAMTLRKEIGDERGMADSELALAWLAFEAAQFEAAESGARTAADQFHKLKMTPNEGLARALLARALLARGKSTDARASAEQALALMKESEDTSARLGVTIDVARVKLASRAPGDVAEALSMLERAVADATHDGLTGRRLEATLALAEAELRSGRIAAGRARLGTLRTDAAAKGFSVIARKAAAAARAG
jgi:eukaryotic-like serine/threonine-protein kinase